MRVLADNCISTVNIPNQLEAQGYVYAFDYNTVLNLYATVHDEGGLAVWDPLSGKVVAEFSDIEKLCFYDTLFLPGSRVGASALERRNGGVIVGVIKIYNLAKDNSVEQGFVIDKDLPMTYPGALALSPQKNLLVADRFPPEWGVYEIFMDWDDLKVLKCREIIPGDDNKDAGRSERRLLGCSQDFQVVRDYASGRPIFSNVKVCFNTEGEVEIKEKETISYYILDGEEKQFRCLQGFVHDEQHLIVANGHEIVLLESATEGSNAHLIASGVDTFSPIRINSEGQLMVCEEKVIKLFEYKCDPRPLQDLCRYKIRNTIPTDYPDKINRLAIPYMLKHHLLYK